MTCIVAVKKKKKVVIGGDSAAVESNLIRRALHPKVFEKGPYRIGYTTSFRMGQLLEHSIDLPLPQDDDLMHFMCTDFVDTIRQGFRDHGFTKISENKETSGTFIVVIGNEIFEINDDYCVIQFQEPYAAVGCGTDYAYGAIHASYKKENAYECVKRGLEAAVEFSTGVMPPFTIIG